MWLDEKKSDSFSLILLTSTSKGGAERSVPGLINTPSPYLQKTLSPTTAELPLCIAGYGQRHRIRHSTVLQGAGKQHEGHGQGSRVEQALHMGKYRPSKKDCSPRAWQFGADCSIAALWGFSEYMLAKNVLSK